MKNNSNSMTYSNLPSRISSYPKYSSAIIRSSSDTDFQKVIPMNKTTYEDQTENYNLEKPIGNPKHMTHKTINAKLFTKGKTKLSQFIQNYSENLRLIGNRRYNEYHPYQFVKDQKESLPFSKIGLFPVPVKCHRKINSNEEMYHYKNIQRAIVMMRRMQYKTQINEDMIMKDSKTHVNLRKIMLLQRWWKLMYKIIFIQRYWKKKLQDREMQINCRFNKFMENFEDFLRKNLLREYFGRMHYHKLYQKPQLNYLMQTKKIIRLQKDDLEKIIKIQSLYRAMRPKRIWKRYIELHKFRELIPKNNPYEFYTKGKKINKLQKLTAIGLVNRLINNIRKYQLNQKRIKKQLLLPIISFKANRQSPTIQINLISGSMRRYAEKQMNAIGPYTHEDMKRLKRSKEKPTFISKTYMLNSKVKCNKDNSKVKCNEDLFKNPIIIQFDANEKNIYYITKKRQANYNNSIIRIQRQIKETVLFPRLQKWSHIPCYIDKVYVPLKVQKYIVFYKKIIHAMNLNTFKKKTQPLKSKKLLFNKNHNNNTGKFDDNELDHIMFLQTQYKQKNIKEANLKSSQMARIIKSIGYITKKRQYGYEKAIALIQKMTKKQKNIQTPATSRIPIKVRLYMSKRYVKNYDKIIRDLQDKIKNYHNKNCFYTDDIIKKSFKDTRCAIPPKEMRDCYEDVVPKIEKKKKCFYSMERIMRSKLKILKCKNIILKFYTKALTTLNKYCFLKPQISQSMITKKRFEDYLLHGLKNIYENDAKKKLNIVAKQTIITIPSIKPKAVISYAFAQEKRQIQKSNQLNITNKVIKKSEIRIVTLLPKLITKKIKHSQIPQLQLKSRPCLINCKITKIQYKNVTKSTEKIESLQLAIRDQINDINKTNDRSNKLRSNPMTISETFHLPQKTIYQSFITKKRKTEYLPQILKLQKQFDLLKHKQNEQNIIKALLKKQNSLMQVNPIKIRPIQKTRSFMIKFHRKQRKNILFVKLIELFAIKNCQEFVFDTLKNQGEQPTFKYPFYLNTIQRHIKFIKSYACQEDSKIKNRLIRLFPKTTTSINILQELLFFTHDNRSALKKDLCVCLCSLIMRTPDDENTILTDCDSQEHQTLKYFNNFCAYDKNNYDPNYLIKRLKQIKLNNTSLFGLTRLVDEEYHNRERGIAYCKKCYYYPDPQCKCGLLRKKGFNDNINDDDLFEMKQLQLEDFPIRDSVHSFQWTEGKNSKGVLIKSKPKIEDSSENNITEMLFKGMTMKNGQYKKSAEKPIQHFSSATMKNELIYKQAKEIRSAKPMKKIEKSKPIIMLRDNSPFEDGKL